MIKNLKEHVAMSKRLAPMMPALYMFFSDDEMMEFKKAVSGASFEEELPQKFIKKINLIRKLKI